MTKNTLKWSEIALWVVGIVCVGTFVLAAVQTASAQAKAIAAMDADWRASANVLPDRTLWSDKRLRDFDPTRIAAMSPLGLLTIPEVKIRVAIFNGTSDEVLDVGAGRVPGTAEITGEGNLAIAAHRDGFFRGLKDIEVGDAVNVQHAFGVNRYRVTEIFIVDPTDVTVLQERDSSTITLITCYPFYFVGSAPRRFIVRAELEASETAS